MFIIRVSPSTCERNRFNVARARGDGAGALAAAREWPITIDERLPDGTEVRIGWFGSLDLSSCGEIKLAVSVDGDSVWIEAEKLPPEIAPSSECRPPVL